MKYHLSILMRHYYSTSMAVVLCLLAVLLLSVNVIVTILPINTHTAMGQISGSNDFLSTDYFGKPLLPSTDNSGGGLQVQPGFSTFSNSQLGFKINYPSDSKVQRGQNSVIINTPGKAVVGIIVFEIGDRKLADFVKWSMSITAQNHPDLRILKVGQDVVSGQPAIYVIYTNTGKSGTPLITLSYYVISGSIGYLLDFQKPTSGSVRAFLLTSNAMLKSFEINQVSLSSSSPLPPSSSLSRQGN
jgi:hypothetical protein